MEGRHPRDRKEGAGHTPGAWRIREGGSGRRCGQQVTQDRPEDFEIHPKSNGSDDKQETEWGGSFKDQSAEQRTDWGRGGQGSMQGDTLRGWGTKKYERLTP